jgi:hypothetical protein
VAAVRSAPSVTRGWGVRVASIVLATLSACGRLAFDAVPADAGELDANADGPDAALPACAMGALPVPATGTVTAMLEPATDDDAGSCGGMGFGEVTYAIDVPPGSGLLVAADLDATTADTLLYVRADCSDPGSELVCDDDGGHGEQAAHRFDSLPPGRYYVHVDGESTGVAATSIQVLVPEGSACTSNGRERCAPGLFCAGTCMVDTCGGAELLSGLNAYVRVPVTTDGTNRHAGTCGEGNDGGARAPEVVYVLRLATAVSNVQISTDNAQTNYDTLIYVRAGCRGAEIACSDDIASSNNRTDVSTGPLPPGDYHVFVDGFGRRSGTAEVTIVVTP